MKYYEMFKILTKIREKEDSTILELMLDTWIDTYAGIKHPDWSFYEIELAINKEEDKDIKNTLNHSLNIFKEFS